jgi:predicted transposase YbfD/YdcC
LNKSYSTHVTEEINYGRLEIRSCKIFTSLVGVDKSIETGWYGLKSIIEITRNVINRNGENYTETAYFISSLDPNQVSAKEFNEGIRNHWSVEVFHYSKDVTFKEDESKCNSGNSAQNLSVIRNIVINLFRENQHKYRYTNLAQAIRLVSNNIPKLWDIISA